MLVVAWYSVRRVDAGLVWVEAPDTTPPWRQRPCATRPYGSAVPDTLDQLILADDPVGVLHKVEEQVEDLRLDVNDFAVAAPQLPSVSVEQEFIELKQHFVRLSQFSSE